MLIRNKINEIKKWYLRKDSLPLMLEGARQVGKTSIVQEFARANNIVLREFNFETKPQFKSIFEKDLDPERIIRELSFIVNDSIKETDLIFFDEIQECPKAINCLKYFAEQFPNFKIISAGSLLSVMISEESFPVGKLEYLKIYPLTL